MMWKWRRRRETQRIRDHSLPREARSGARLAREIEAFLSGSSGEWFLARGRDVPTWAYVNQVAHAEPELLCQLAARAPAGGAGRGGRLQDRAGPGGRLGDRAGPEGRLGDGAGPAGQLQDRAGPGGRIEGLSWRGAVTVLANEIIQVGGSDPASIRRIQLDRLLPFESALMSPVSQPISPEQLVARGRACLRDHPSCEPPF